jgi:hypothetical protein
MSFSKRPEQMRIERDAVAVSGIHVRLYFENKAREILGFGGNNALVGGARSGRRRVLEKVLEERLYAEIGHRAAEIKRGKLAVAHARDVELVARGVKQLDVVAELREQHLAEQLAELRVVGLAGYIVRRAVSVTFAREQLYLPELPVVDAPEVAAVADRPVHRTGLYAERLLYLLHEVERIFAEAIHFIDESKYRYPAHAADMEKLYRLRLDALGPVYEHDGAVRGDKSPVSVLTEILMSGGVENIDVVTVVVELHDARGNRDSSLFLDLHPVGYGVFVSLAAFDRAGESYRPAVKQQLLGQGRFAGVGVGNYRESPPLADARGERVCFGHKASTF